MNKQIGVFAIIILLVSNFGCSLVEHKLGMDSDAFSVYKQQAMTLLDGVEWLSFDVRWEQYRNGDSLWTHDLHMVLHYDDKEDMVFVNDSSLHRYFRITKDVSETIDWGENKAIMYKRKLGGEYTSMGLQQELNFYIRYMMYYIIPSNHRFFNQSIVFLSSYEDSVFHGHSVRKYLGHIIDGASLYDNKNSSGNENIIFFVNNRTNVADSIHYYRKYADNTSERIIRFSNLRYDNRQRYVDSIFDYSNPRYANFSHHDEKNPSNPWSENKSVNDEVAKFPLLNLRGDTTHIAEQEGWVLLNFWTLNCGPCIQQLMEYKREQDSLGYRILEDKGIKILAINQSSDNMELIGEIADKACARDIILSGKGIGGVIELRYYGCYYLISPNKELVFETYHLGDYSELLKAKEAYEKKHANK